MKINQFIIIQVYVWDAQGVHVNPEEGGLLLLKGATSSPPATVQRESGTLTFSLL